jgi:hypothetical protein
MKETQYILMAYPFADYPHSAGTWSWDTDADQVVLVVQGLRRSLVEYSKIMWQTRCVSLSTLA